MRLPHDIHLAYCTNIHRGETWAETFQSLDTHTLAVRDTLEVHDAFAVGLRLSHRAAVELSDPKNLVAFQRWLDRQSGYLFTINGFPYGNFHQGRVKEEVFRPDWTDVRRLEYTNLLFDLLAELTPNHLAGSVSTLPGSFKEFHCDQDQRRRIRENLWSCVEHISAVSEKKGRLFHLGLEPEPLGLIETIDEFTTFFEEMKDDHPEDQRLFHHLGINYDTCHMAIEYEEAKTAVAKLKAHGVKLSKIHLSSAVKTRPTPEACRALKGFADDVYLHQVIARSTEGTFTRYRDLPLALASAESRSYPDEEWRVHFHVPIHSQKTDLFDPTSDHILDFLDVLGEEPELCKHLEIETYTWEVLPSAYRTENVVSQLVKEYEWCLAELKKRGLA